MADPGRNKNLSADHCPAAAVSSRMGISGSLDHSLCPHGHQCCQNLSDSAFQIPQHRTESVHRPAGGEFLLESRFLQSPGFRTGLFLAVAVMDLGVPDDPQFPDG